MDEAAVVDYIRNQFGGLNVVEANGDYFFIYDPDRDLPPNRQMPFATLVTSDFNDPASNLNRPGVFRLNIGVRKETYHALFGPPPPFPKDGGIVDTGHDFTALDQIMPHPVYAAMHWVCVLNPSEATFQTVREFLAEAYEQVSVRHSRHSP